MSLSSHELVARRYGDRFTTMTIEEFKLDLPLIPEPVLQARVLRRIGLLYQQTDLVESEAYTQRALLVAEATGDGKLIVEVLYVLICCYILKYEYDEAQVHIGRGLALAKELGYELMYIDILHLKGRIHEKALEYPQALAICWETLEYYEREGITHSKAITLGQIALIKTEMGSYEEALELYLNQFTLWKELGVVFEMAKCYGNITHIYITIQDYDSALLFAHRSLELIPGKIEALQHIAMVSISKQDATTALDYLQQAAHEIQQQQKSGNRKPEVNNALLFSQAYELLNDNRKALSFCEYAVQLAEEIRDPLLCCTGYYNTGLLYRKLREYQAAIDFLTKAYLLFEPDSGNAMLPVIHEALSKVYEETEQAEKALVHFKKYAALKEEHLNKEKLKSIAEVQAKFDVQTAEREKELFRVRNVELSAALEEVRLLNERLTKLNHEKNEVLGVVAHDLKSPLLGVKLVSSLLKEHHRTIPDMELDRQLDTIVHTSDRMLTIATGLLKAQALENEDVHRTIERVDILSGIEVVLDRYREPAMQKDITLCFDRPNKDVFLYTHADGCQQIVENLLGNAIKFSSRGTKIDIRVRQSRGNVQVEVQDEGPGISLKDRKKLYGKFVRLSAQPTGGESTTGLGLWIVRKTVDAMQGSIRCISQPGKGTKFVVVLRNVREPRNSQ